MKYFPDQSLEQLYHFNSCAVVSSSHALIQHRYGPEIDRHDCVLRFNCAPTKHFEQHVGSRTDMRLINTKIPNRYCKKEFLNDSIEMYNHEIVVVRHNNAYRIIDQKLDTSGDRYKSLPKYISYIKTHGNRQLFIQYHVFGPALTRDMKDFCRDNGKCGEKDNLGSPSTGVFGVLMMTRLCNWVYVYEMVPSDVEPVKYLYYYDEEKTFNVTTYFHPFTAEHLYLTHLSETSSDDVRKTGVLLFRGANCTA
ncbi:beta-galactoside alpha-2,6-sialyltransferase 2-like [Branchiostoma floridae]|uniref:beta-galactoside alpha-(2,6)-sialyltransferase n=1 Tax=Branchiostoma floridae TaxID=7739 RepID=A0A9J7L7Q3_BRAFL|nr:beta-galactoside alpha-2,6-sialyltransferase 2-like [Branchiostoma floridae]